MKTIATIEGCPIVEYEDGRVAFTAKAAIDADGANGQHGKKAAYMVGDHGLEALGNGGMRMHGGKVAGGAPWFRDIVILEGDQPAEFPGGIIASKTAYRYPDLGPRDPAAYVDAATVPYIVVPPAILHGVPGAVLGCKARVTCREKSVDALVADVGPGAKLGELSIAAAEAIGIPSSPRSGGTERKEVHYELWPGVPAEINGITYRVQRSNGTYV